MDEQLATIPVAEESLCPHCGRQMPGRLEVDLEHNRAKANNRTARISPRQARILDALERAYPQPARMSFMSNIIRKYGDNASPNSIQVAICQMRPKLSDIGVRIFACGKQTYQLHIGGVSAIPSFSEDEVEDLRRAIRVLQRARKIIG